MKKDFITLKEAASRMKISTRTLQRHITNSNGKVRHVKIPYKGRFKYLIHAQDSKRWLWIRGIKNPGKYAGVKRNKEKWIKNQGKHRKARRDFINNYKLKHPCSCGESHPACLEFHHKDPKTKKFAISNSTSKGIATIEKEIKKCEILCANCHRKRHH